MDKLVATLRAVLDEAIRSTDATALYHAPATEFARLRVNVEPHLQDALRLFLGMARNPGVIDGVEQLMEQQAATFDQALAEDPNAALVRDLFEEAHAVVPLSPMAAWYSEPSDDDFDRIARVFHPTGKLIDAESLAGEHRATVLLDATIGVVEDVHGHFLRIVWMLRCFAVGRWEKRPENLGALVPKSRDFLGPKFGALVDLDAPLLRNAVAHRHWRYDPSNDTVIMWDRKKPKRSFSLPELEQKIGTIYRTAGMSFTASWMAYFLREFWVRSGLVRELIQRVDVLGGADGEPRTRATAELDAFMEDAFAPVGAFIDAARPAEAKRRRARRKT